MQINASLSYPRRFISEPALLIHLSTVTNVVGCRYITPPVFEFDEVLITLPDFHRRASLQTSVCFCYGYASRRSLPRQWLNKPQMSPGSGPMQIPNYNSGGVPMQVYFRIGSAALPRHFPLNLARGSCTVQRSVFGGQYVRATSSIFRV